MLPCFIQQHGCILWDTLYACVKHILFTGEGILVTWNLQDKNYSPLTISEDLTCTEATNILHNLAKLHTATAVYLTKVGQEQFLKDFPHLDSSVYTTEGMFNRVNRDLQVQ